MKAQAGDFLLQAWRGKRAVLFRRGSGKTSLQPDYRGLRSMIVPNSGREGEEVRCLKRVEARYVGWRSFNLDQRD